MLCRPKNLGYRCPIKESGNYSGVIHDKILFILSKIIFLTIFYEVILFSILCALGILIPVAGDSIYAVFQGVLYSLGSVAISYAMYLMMDHNVEHWLKFLQFIVKLRLYYLCCCCGSNLARQLNGTDLNEPKVNKMKTMETKTLNTKTLNTKILLR